MTIRTILVPVYGNGGDARCLSAAADVARCMAAHITALYCDWEPADLLQPMSNWESGAAFSETFLKTLQDRADAGRRGAARAYTDWLEQDAAAFAVSPGKTRAATAEFVVAAGKPVSVMRQYAVVADLVVVAIPEQGDPQRAGVLQEALFDTGRPVLAVAATPSPAIFSAPVAIAWNHSAESARALNAALPIIEHVGEAVVLQAGHHEDEAAAQQVLAYLGRHDVRAHALKLGQTGKPGDLVAAKVRELGAGLLVMGAYSHIRAREFVFGGMTGYMLEKAPIPLLLAH